MKPEELAALGASFGITCLNEELFLNGGAISIEDASCYLMNAITKLTYEKKPIDTEPVIEKKNFVDQERRAFTKVKTRLPTPFDGTRNTQVVAEFIWATDTYIRMNDIPVGEQKDFVGTNITGPAMTWFQRERSKPYYSSLSPRDFMLAFKTYFEPQDSKTQAYAKLKRCSQTSTLEKYINGFQDILLLLPEISIKDQMDMFKDKLNPDLYQYVVMQNPSTLETLIAAAQRADEIDKQKKYHKSNFDNRTPTKNTDYERRAASIVKDDPMELGEMKNVVGKKSNLSYAERQDFMKKGLCFNCQKQGHIAPQCPEKSSFQKA